MSVRKRTWKTRSGVEKEAWVVDYADQSGKRRLKTFTKKKEADVFRDKAAAEVRAGTHVPDSTAATVAEACDEWIEAVKRGRGDRGPAEPSTVRQYQSHVKGYIKPKLGKMKLSQLSQPRVMEFRDEILGEVSRPLAKKVLASLKGIISEMQDRGRMTVNPAARVKIGNSSRDREEVVIPEIADVKAILAKLDEKAAELKPWRRWRALIATAIHTGMRASELRGLPWEAVDFDQGKISVYQRADESGLIGPPKSKSGYRSITVPADLVKILREWKLEAGGAALAFANGKGNPESMANIFNRAWKPIQIAAGVADPQKDEKGNVVRDKEGKPTMKPRHNFHTLRHFHASLLIRDDANPKDVQVEMGHSSIQVTYDLYGHLFRDEEADKRATERAERLAGSLA